MKGGKLLLWIASIFILLLQRVSPNGMHVALFIFVMQQHKVIRLLRQLVPQHAQFSLFIHSTYFNKHRGLIVLYEAIKAQLSNTDTAVDLALVWACIHPEKAYDPSKMASQLRKLGCLCEEFLVQQELRMDPYLGEKLKLRGLLRLRVPEIFETELRKNVASIAASGLEYDQTFLFLLETTYMKISNRIRHRASRQPSPDLEVARTALDQFHLIHALRLKATALSQDRTFGTVNGLDSATASMVNLAIGQYGNSPLIFLYANIVRLLAGVEDVDIVELLAAFKSMATKLDKDEELDIFGMLHNALVYYANNKGRYIDALKSFFQWAEANSFLIGSDNQILPALYKNMVRACILSKSPQQAMEWADTYRAHLPVHSRMSMYSFCMAEVYFGQGEFSNAVKSLNLVDHKDAFVSLAARRLLAQCYYELGYEEPMRDLLNSFNMYLRESKATKGYHRTAYLQFLSTFRVLLRKPKATQLQKARRQLAADDQHLDQSWFLQKIDHLLARIS